MSEDSLSKLNVSWQERLLNALQNLYSNKWFIAGVIAYPMLHWQLIAEKPELQLGLYKLQK